MSRFNYAPWLLRTIGNKAKIIPRQTTTVEKKKPSKKVTIPHNQIVNIGIVSREQRSVSTFVSRFTIPRRMIQRIGALDHPADKRIPNIDASGPPQSGRNFLERETSCSEWPRVNVKHERGLRSLPFEYTKGEKKKGGNVATTCDQGEGVIRNLFSRVTV